MQDTMTASCSNVRNIGSSPVVPAIMGAREKPVKHRAKIRGRTRDKMTAMRNHILIVAVMVVSMFEGASAQTTPSSTPATRVAFPSIDWTKANEELLRH